MPDHRDSILTAADHLLARRGFRHMTIDDVAAEAGIGKGTVYLYFTSKDDVALAVIESHIQAAFDALRKIAGKASPVAVRLQEMLVARVVVRADRFRHYTDALHELLAAVRPQLLEQRERQLDEEGEIFAEVLREATSGRAGRAALCRVARALLTGTNSLLPYYLTSDQLGGRPLLTRRAGDVARILVTGALAELTRRGARAPYARRLKVPA